MKHCPAVTGPHISTALALLLALLFPGQAHAEQVEPNEDTVSPGSDNTPRSGSPLTLDEVLQSVLKTHPQLESAQQKVEKAKGNVLAARGGWDPSLSIRGRWAPVGYYNQGQVDALVRQATPLWGLGLYAGYRLGLGSYPVYKGELETLSGGELRAGIELPFLKNGPIDARRAEIQKTKVFKDAADCNRQATQLKLGQSAAKAYWTWVATGLEVRIQKELLAVAQERDEGLREQAALGALPAIVVVDNQRLVLDRKAKLVKAEQDFNEAVVDLSLYLRDLEEETPILIDEQRVPGIIPEVRIDLDEINSDIRAAISRRPEFCKLQMERKAAEVEVRLRKNQVAPSVNGQAFVARDFGNGPTELEPTEFGVGLKFEMPLALRKARGKYKSAKADARRLDAQLRGLGDRIAAEIRQARIDLDAAKQQVSFTTQQVDVARQLADAEREKFRQGASDLVIVNLREIAAAEAARLEIEARADHHRARADYLRATGQGV